MGPATGAGAVASVSVLKSHGERLLFRLEGPLPVGAGQDVEYDRGEGGQQQAQHRWPDAPRARTQRFQSCGAEAPQTQCGSPPPERCPSQPEPRFRRPPASA